MHRERDPSNRPETSRSGTMDGNSNRLLRGALPSKDKLPALGQRAQAYQQPEVIVLSIRCSRSSRTIKTSTRGRMLPGSSSVTLPSFRHRDHERDRVVTRLSLDSRDPFSFLLRGSQTFPGTLIRDSPPLTNNRHDCTVTRRHRRRPTFFSAEKFPTTAKR